MASFNAREADQFFPVGGSFSASGGGKAFVASLKCVNIVGKTAWVGGPVTATNNPTWYGKWLFAKVEQTSFFGLGGKVSSGFVSPDLSCSLTNSMGTPVDGPFNVLWGIINVHGS